MPVRDDLLDFGCATIAAALKVRLPQLSTCDKMAGQLSLKDVQTIGAKAPAVLVSRLGARQKPGASRPEYHASMAAYVITKHQMDVSREMAAQVICQALLQRVPDATWGIPEFGPAFSVADQSLNTTATKSAGIALWAVTWMQPFILDQGPVPEAVAPELYVAQAPNIGATHEGDYQQVGADE